MNKTVCLILMVFLAAGVMAQAGPRIRESGESFAYAALECQGPYALIPQKLGELMAEAGRQGLEATDGPSVIYYSAPGQTAPADLRWDVCVPVNALANVAPPLKKGEYKFPLVAEVIHKGSYADVGSAYPPLMQFIARGGYTVCGPICETYLDDPTDTPPGECRTLIMAPVAKQQPETAAARAVPVAGGLYLMEGLEGGNVAFLVTGEGVLVVDSGTTPEEGERIVAEIARITDQPIRFLVLTHYHGDHTFGLQAYPPSTVVIAQQNTADNMRRLTEPRLRGMMDKRMPERIAAQKLKVEKLRKKKGKELAKVEEALKALETQLAELKALRFVYPAVTFQTKLSVFLGGQEVEVVHLGRAHTDGDALVHFPGLKALHAGDLLFAGSYPYIGVEAGADTANWIATIERAASWDVETVIPGHGRMTDKQGFLKMAAYLSELREAVKGAIAAGRSLEEAKKMPPLPAWKGFARERQLPANIEAVYKELARKKE